MKEIIKETAVINVASLIAFLQTQPKNALVLLSSDDEGNQISPLGSFATAPNEVVFYPDQSASRRF